MSDLTIGASGVRAYQTALGTVGENIANIGSAGYTRRSVKLNEIAGGIGITSDRSPGNGVLLTGIVRATDIYASAAVRGASADLARTTTGATWLDRINDSLTGNQLTSRVTSFFNAANGLAADPQSTALRGTMLDAAQQMGISFTATGKALDQVASDIDTASRQAATDLTSLGAALAKINDGIGRTNSGTTAAAQLADQRDSILDQMSALVDIQVQTDPLGRATVRIAGASEPFVVLDNSSAVTYSRQRGSSGAFWLSSSGQNAPIDPQGGAMAGMVYGADRVASMRGALGDVAASIVKTVNDTQAAGDDLNGTPGKPLLAIGATPTDLSVDPALTGTDIAAAVRGGGPRNAGNLTTLMNARATLGFEPALTTLVTDNATATKQRNTIADAQSAIRDGAMTALSGSTGVNLDSEAVDLMRFQQAYSASSRVIQVARDTFQSILEIR